MWHIRSTFLKPKTVQTWSWILWRARPYGKENIGHIASAECRSRLKWDISPARQTINHDHHHYVVVSFFFLGICRWLLMDMHCLDGEIGGTYFFKGKFWAHDLSVIMPLIAITYYLSPRTFKVPWRSKLSSDRLKARCDFSNYQYGTVVGIATYITMNFMGCE